MLLLISILFGSLTWLSTLGAIPIPLLWMGYGVAFLSYLGTVVILRKEHVPLYIVFLAALVLRLPWLAAGLSLSDDAWRYLHDGRSQVAGVNPYRYAPDAVGALEYAGPEHALINNRDLPTIYPPAAQLAFRMAIHLGGTLLSWKALLLIADLAVGVGLAMLLVTRGRPPTLCAAYLLHPLPIIEFAGNGHLDAFGICALVFAFVLVQRKPFGSGVALAISGATKYLAFPLLPFFLRSSGRHAGLVVFGTVATLALLYLPFLDFPPFGSLGTFAKTFDFNGPIYLVVNGVVGQTLARMFLAAVVLGLLSWLWFKGYGVEDAAVVWIGSVLLVSPIVHPWYVIWLIPFLAWRTEWWALAWSGTVVGSYYVLTDWRADAVWNLPPIVMLVEYVPVYLLLAVRLNRRFLHDQKV